MKPILVSILAFIFMAGLALAQAEKTHNVTGEVVKADAAAKTITLKVEGKEMSLPVEGDAVAELKTIAVGDSVTATCRDDAKGNHEAITKIIKKST